MKKNLTLSAVFVMVAFLMIGVTSCNKYKKEPADQIVGDYIGSGTDANGMPFIGQIMRITKISQKRVKVQSVGHNSIATFEIDVEGFVDKVASVDDATYSLGAQIDGESITLALSGTDEESFGGTKQ